MAKKNKKENKDEQKERKVERSVFFYDIVVTELDANNKAVKSEQQNKRIVKVLQYLKNTYNKMINAQNEEEAKKLYKTLFVPTEKDDLVYIIVEDEIKEDEPIKFKIVLSKTNALPYIDKIGKLSDMDHELKGNFNLAEITHCIYFPDTQIMGAEFNFYGARPSVIANYLPYKSDEIYGIKATSKVKNDIFNQIDKNKGLTVFELCVKNTNKMQKIFMENHPIFGAALANKDEYETLEICFKKRRSKNKNGFIPPIGIKDMQEIVNNNREDINRFKISTGAYKDTIDLLGDRLITKKEFVYTENRTIDSKQMFTFINNSYYSLLQEM